MLVGVLGETTVRLGDVPVGLTSRKLRQVVAALALAGGRPVSFDALVDALWGDHPPEGLPGTLHAYIARLRNLLEPDRLPRAPARVLVTVGTGYALRTGDDALDASRFERSVVDVDRRLARPDPLARPGLLTDELTAAERELGEALALWRGEPYADLGDHDAVLAERARLDELRVVALEDRATSRLALGHHATVSAELEALTGTHPLRERFWLLSALALNAAGRQADALDALRRFTAQLDEQLGVDPSPLVRDLQVRILRQDPTVAWSAADAVARAVPAPTGHLTVAAPVLPPWPMVGRRGELDAVLAALDRAGAGLPSFVAVSGEAGIGKSRLCAEAALRAVREGARLLPGRCSQDDGAPPLWPWQQVLQALGHDLEVAAGEDEGAGFRTWATIVRRIRDAARQETLVVVLDDLHWADVPSLRVLRLLVETVSEGRLLVLVTWRPHPEPAGALADVVETLARAHAVRLPLAGLDGEAAAEVVAAISTRPPDPSAARELVRRTDGNPFYLVEFARLAGEGDLDAILAPTATPTPVRDVVARRISRLPDDAVATLRAAGVVGRTFDLAALAAAADRREEQTLLRHLDLARDAGLVTEDGADTWRFGHALVRDAAYAGLGPTRAARAHARVAEALHERPGQETETAHHWLAAGPGHASRAWRAAVRAAEVARRLHAHEEAAALLRQARSALSLDAAAEPRDRFELLMSLGEVERWSGQWSRLKEATESALDLAGQLDDLLLVARAASAMATGAFWLTTQYGEIHHRQVRALRRCLTELPAGDSAARCRVMNALATELYYSSGHRERDALVEESAAMARRLGSDDLLVDVLISGYIATWRPSTAPAREAQVREAMEICLRIGDGARLVIAATLLTVVQAELGRVEAMWETEAGARSEAERLRLPYGLVVLDGLVVGWHAMSGREEESTAALGRMVEASRRIVLFQMEEGLLGATMASRMWQGDLAALLPAMTALHRTSPLPVGASICQAMVRSGRVDEARRYLAEHPVDIPDDDGDWFSMLLVAAVAEVSAWTGAPGLAGRAYAWLAPYAGRSVQSGSGVAQGPVDAFLALAAAATGERETASRHADDAAAAMRRWNLPRCAQWFSGVREHFGI